jgi:hypothetical protein
MAGMLHDVERRRAHEHAKLKARRGPPDASRAEPERGRGGIGRKLANALKRLWPARRRR